MVLPPIDEQVTIVEFLDRQTGAIDGMVAKIHEAIDRIKELRAALISAAVTGKIDVRDYPCNDGAKPLTTKDTKGTKEEL